MRLGMAATDWSRGRIGMIATEPDHRHRAEATAGAPRGTRESRPRPADGSPRRRSARNGSEPRTARTRRPATSRPARPPAR
jgi:hypothetical protein